VIEDRESTNVEAAAYLAREADPPDDDRPTLAECADLDDVAPDAHEGCV
jgi:hypothetical protein